MVNDDRTFGQKVADRVAETVGSWPFVIIQSIILGCWLALNVLGLVKHWDPYPFILLNLVLSFQAAYTAPIIMMSQNRQGEKDRQLLHADFLLDQEAKHEMVKMLDQLRSHEELLLSLVEHMKVEQEHMKTKNQT